MDYGKIEYDCIDIKFLKWLDHWYDCSRGPIQCGILYEVLQKYKECKIKTVTEEKSP